MPATADNDDAMRRIRWAADNWDKVEEYFVRRVVEEYAESLGLSKFLHLIFVKDGKKTLYGVSLEPELFEGRLDEHETSLFYYVAAKPEETSVGSSSVAELVDPFVFDRIPKILPKDEGFFLLRDSTSDERAEWSRRNDALLSRMNLTPVETSDRGWFKEDLRYNTVRGEFGIGEVKRDTSWRKSLRRLDGKGPKLAKELEDVLFKMKIPSSEEFEKRTREWLDNNEDAMVLIVGE